MIEEIKEIKPLTLLLSQFAGGGVACFASAASPPSLRKPPHHQQTDVSAFSLWFILNMRKLIHKILNSEIILSSIILGICFIVLCFIIGFIETLKIYIVLGGITFVLRFLTECYSVISDYISTRQLEVSSKKVVIYFISGLILFILTVSYYEIEAVKLIIIGGVISFVGVFLEIGLYLLYFRFKNKFVLLMITDITNYGFIITRKKQNKSYRWNEFSTIKFNNNFDKVTLKKNTLGKVVISKSFINWYLFIKSIPLSFNEFDHKYVYQFFDKLTPCEICGDVAVDKNICCSCGAEEWNANLTDEYETEDDYIKSQQLELFSTMDKDEEFTGFYEENNGNKCFELNEKWKPVITKHDVIEYSSENYWEL